MLRSTLSEAAAAINRILEGKVEVDRVTVYAASATFTEW
jgi:hypothetical protein